jgi:ribonuclease HI
MTKIKEIFDRLYGQALGIDFIRHILRVDENILQEWWNLAEELKSSKVNKYLGVESLFEIPDIPKEVITVNRKLTAYCDGGCRGNPGIGAGGFTIQEFGKEIIFGYTYLKRATNNEAEYVGLQRTIKALIELSPSEAIIYLDSQLVLKQVQGLWKVKTQTLAPFVEEARRLEKQLKSTGAKISYRWIKGHGNSSGNNRADELCNLSMDKKSTK